MLTKTDVFCICVLANLFTICGMCVGWGLFDLAIWLRKIVTGG